MLRPVKIDDGLIRDANGELVADLVETKDIQFVVNAINDYDSGHFAGQLSYPPRKGTMLYTIEKAIRYYRSMSKSRLVENCSLTGEYSECIRHRHVPCPTYEENLRLPPVDQCRYEMKSLVLITNFGNKYRLTLENIEDERVQSETEK